MSESILRAAESGRLAPVYLVTGDASVLVGRAVERLVAATLPRCGLPAFNHTTLRLGDGAGAEVLATARTLPMMADLRLVVVRDLEAGKESFFAALVDYLAEPSPTTVLVATGTGYPPVRKGGKNWKARVGNLVKKTEAVSVAFDASSVSPTAFAREHAASLGKRLEGADAEILVELVGRDPDVIVQEVEKVSLYAGDAEVITGAAIHEACSSLAEADVWELTAGLAARDTDVALGSLHRLLAGSGREGDDQPHKLLGLITWQLRQVLAVSQLVRQRRPESEIRRAVRMRPDQFRRVRAAVDRGYPGAAEIFETLLRANRSMNRSRAGDKRVLEALVVELCGL